MKIKYIHFKSTKKKSPSSCLEITVFNISFYTHCTFLHYVYYCNLTVCNCNLQRNLQCIIVTYENML